MEALKKAVNVILPPPQKGEDGRGQWGSRWVFIMAAMGGGWSVAFGGYVITTYYVPLISWIMHTTYFRVSFVSPLRWTGRVRGIL